MQSVAQQESPKAIWQSACLTWAAPMNFQPVSTALLICTALCGCSPSWKDENECIARSLSGVTGDRAASFITTACREYFSPKPDPGSWTALPIPELVLVAGTLKTTADTVSGTLYNGSSRTINRITLMLTHRNKKESAASAPTSTHREYDIVVPPIAPHQAGSFAAQIMDEGDVDAWGLVGAKGTASAPK